MSEGQSHSVTNLLRQLQSDDPQAYQDAAGKIWGRYLADLLVLARRQLSPRIRQREDEQDILQSMFKSFCVRQRRGEFTLDDRNDLWRLLVAITQNKARTVTTRHGRNKRDYRREEIKAAAAPGDWTMSSPNWTADIAPTPAEAAVLVEELQRRLESLDEPLRQLALWKLEGYTNAEIAGGERMDCSVRAVERKLKLIRQIWGEPAPPEKKPPSADQA